MLGTQPLLITAAILGLALVTSARAAPRCNQLKNKAAATKAFTSALRDPKSALGVAYEGFLDAHKEDLENRHSSLIPAGPESAEIRAWAYYRKPVANKWMQVLPMGTSPGHEGADKENATPTCVDEYLMVVSVPLEYKWHGEHVVFVATLQVTNGVAGAKVGEVVPMQVSPIVK